VPQVSERPTWRDHHYLITLFIYLFLTTGEAYITGSKEVQLSSRIHRQASESICTNTAHPNIKFQQHRIVLRLSWRQTLLLFVMMMMSSRLKKNMRPVVL
jgi:hypothetical protein